MWVVLMKTVTADGLCEMKDEIKVGDIYFVDLDRIQSLVWGHMDRTSESDVVRESIWCDASINGGYEGWMPTEFFALMSGGVVG